MKEIKIKYNGEWPTLCSGRLEVWLDNDYYDFGKRCLISGGYCNYHSEEIKEGEWKLDPEMIPEDFPSEYVDELIKTINAKIEFGCCGGCI
jgi:hypothetical protein